MQLMQNWSGIHTSEDARRIAKKHLPWMVFDYIDGAAGEGLGDQLNQQAIRAMRLQTRILVDVEKRNIAKSILGMDCQLPFGISPMGMCNLSCPNADLMLARLAAKHTIPIGASTAASSSLERIAKEANGNAWFQLYFGGDSAVSDSLLDRAEAAGYEVLIFTVDVPEVGRRPRELRHGFKMPFKIGPRQFLDFACHPQWSIRTLMSGAPKLANFDTTNSAFDRTRSRAGVDWSFFDRIRDRWKGKLIVKGVLHSEDAQQLVTHGADAIQVSSHGGRQLESVPEAIHALARIRAAVGEHIPLIYDSGIRSGEDICKAYAMGADFVMLGRPLLFAMAAGGEKGLNQLTDVLAQETSIALAQMGLNDISQVDSDVLL